MFKFLVKVFRSIYLLNLRMNLVDNLTVVMPPTSKKLRGHIGLGLSVQSVSLSVSQSVSLSVCLSVMREHSVRNRYSSDLEIWYEVCI